MRLAARATIASALAAMIREASILSLPLRKNVMSESSSPPSGKRSCCSALRTLESGSVSYSWGETLGLPLLAVTVIYGSKPDPVRLRLMPRAPRLS